MDSNCSAASKSASYQLISKKETSIVDWHGSLDGCTAGSGVAGDQGTFIATLYSFLHRQLARFEYYTSVRFSACLLMESVLLVNTILSLD